MEDENGATGDGEARGRGHGPARLRLDTSTTRLCTMYLIFFLHVTGKERE